MNRRLTAIVEREGYEALTLFFETAPADEVDRLKAELERAFRAPDDTYHALSAADVIARNRAPTGA